MKRRAVYIILGLLVVAAVGGVFVWQSQSKGDEPEISRSTTVERGDLSVAVSASGKIKPEQRVNLAFEVPNRVAEVLVEVADEVKGTVPHLYVSLKPGFDASEDLAKKISNAVSDVVGKIARPSKVYIVPDMPKTRSGKIMRRILASISNFKDVGDVTTLANPHIVEEIRQQVQD